METKRLNACTIGQVWLSWRLRGGGSRFGLLNEIHFHCSSNVYRRNVLFAAQNLTAYSPRHTLSRPAESASLTPAHTSSRRSHRFLATTQASSSLLFGDDSRP